MQLMQALCHCNYSLHCCHSFPWLFVQMSEAVLPTDSRVLAKMKELVKVGVRRVPEMQRHLKHYVENDLFAAGNVPPFTDARFWPSSKTVVNCIYKTARKLRYVIGTVYFMA